jgi:aminoglycoside phosphotransferase
VLLLDSDVLFFQSPQFLIEQASGRHLDYCWYNRDIESAYTVSFDRAATCAGVNLAARLNTGLALLRRDIFRLEWFEEFLAIPGILSHFWRTEQTLLALAGSRVGAQVLPPEYDVRLDNGGPFGPVRHYVGTIRHLMYGEGMNVLARRGVLKQPEWPSA